MNTTTTRRAVLAGSAAAIPAAALAGVPAPNSPDPVFAAIERHRAAFKLHGDLIGEEEGLWERIPEERRQWSYNLWILEPPADCADAPEWIAWQKAKEASAAECVAMVAVVSTEPTTIKGALALINYCLEGDDLGVYHQIVDGDEAAVDLTEKLLETLAAALPKIVA